MTEIICYADLETSSECDLRIHGTHRYAEHPTTQVQLFAYSFGTEGVKVWDRTKNQTMPSDLKAAFENPDVIFWFWNSFFDRTLIENVLKITLPQNRFRCAMASALSHGLPASLEKCGEVVGLKDDEKKIKDGHRLVLKFCRPKKSKTGELKWQLPKDNAEDWNRYIDYCRNDVLAMKAIIAKTPKWNYPGNATELDYWLHDQKRNSRGMFIDLELANAAMIAIADTQTELAKSTHKMTDGAVETAGQRDAMLAHIVKQYGYDLPNMQKATITKLVEDDETPQALRELLQVRLSVCTTSTAKYKRLINVTSSTDSRLRGTIQYCGASRTGRDSGRNGFQPQNLARPTIPHEEILAGIESLKGGYADLVGINIMELTSSALRYAICAPEGKKLIVSDLAGIENRALAYLAGEGWKLEAFREFDAGRGSDLYKSAYARAFAINENAVTKEQRQVGKVLELACLAPGVKVLTNSGYKRIVEVSKADKLWDGVEWVKHQGTVLKGVRKVVLVDGIHLTPDHSVLINKIWSPAGQLALNGKYLYRALATGSRNLPSSVSHTVPPVVYIKSRLSALAGLLRTPWNYLTCRGVNLLGVIAARKINQINTEKCIGATRILSQASKSEEAYSVALAHVSTGATTLATRGIKIMGDEVSSFTNLGGRIESYFWSTLQPLKGGITRLVNSIWTGSIMIKGTNRGILGLYLGKKTVATDGQLENYKLGSTSWSPVYDIMNSGHRNRFTVKTDSGHLIVHNCGYGGGVGSIATFATTFGIDLDAMAATVLPSIPDDILAEADSFYDWMDNFDIKAAQDKAKKAKEPDDWRDYYEATRTHRLHKQVHKALESLKRLWRREHQATVKFWKDADNAVRSAIETPNKKFPFGKCYAARSGKWVKVVLPSSHVICYPAMKVLDDNQIVFRGIDQFTKKWGEIKTLGSKIVENCVQAFSRDIFKFHELNAERARYNVVLVVHDEIVSEVEDTDEFTAHGLERIMSEVPPWATGMPISAEGFESYRYRK